MLGGVKYIIPLELVRRGRFSHSDRRLFMALRDAKSRSRDSETIPIPSPPSLPDARPLVLRFFLFWIGVRWQIWRLVVHFAAARLLDLVHKGCSIVALGVGQGIGLALVIPVFGIQALGLFEVRDRLGQMSGLVKVLAKPKLGDG